MKHFVMKFLVRAAVDISLYCKGKKNTVEERRHGGKRVISCHLRKVAPVMHTTSKVNMNSKTKTHSKIKTT